ncbi:hypothetical protein CEUSTIGMA_g10347.t1 [Chlamydomonas eustigma]|uniref:Uncharacterized protein n=1 Tax=Chlamydomonas eustigma TaxID=1157962 RepID=A0A250XJE2_9CHLO|nr:hypothetical protein CEUSTIGMA_g10347.t1 [Chlamydomonas eustigma]|eukprot:GAX82920.1 hypothetical protein CEUSTIGMA_g10347.t1 [Chlamydomonas eustigma]
MTGSTDISFSHILQDLLRRKSKAKTKADASKRVTFKEGNDESSLHDGAPAIHSLEPALQVATMPENGTEGEDSVNCTTNTSSHQPIEESPELIEDKVEDLISSLNWSISEEIEHPQKHQAPHLNTRATKPLIDVFKSLWKDLDFEAGLSIDKRAIQLQRIRTSYWRSFDKDMDVTDVLLGRDGCMWYESSASSRGGGRARGDMHCLVPCGSFQEISPDLKQLSGAAPPAAAGNQVPITFRMWMSKSASTAASPATLEGSQLIMLLNDVTGEAIICSLSGSSSTFLNSPATTQQPRNRVMKLGLVSGETSKPGGINIGGSSPKEVGSLPGFDLPALPSAADAEPRSSAPPALSGAPFVRVGHMRNAASQLIAPADTPLQRFKVADLSIPQLPYSSSIHQPPSPVSPENVAPLMALCSSSDSLPLVRCTGRFNQLLRKNKPSLGYACESDDDYDSNADAEVDAGLGIVERARGISNRQQQQQGKTRQRLTSMSSPEVLDYASALGGRAGQSPCFSKIMKGGGSNYNGMQDPQTYRFQVAQLQQPAAASPSLKGDDRHTATTPTSTLMYSHSMSSVSTSSSSVKQPSSSTSSSPTWTSKLDLPGAQSMQLRRHGAPEGASRQIVLGAGDNIHLALQRHLFTASPARSSSLIITSSTDPVHKAANAGVRNPQPPHSPHTAMMDRMAVLPLVKQEKASNSIRFLAEALTNPTSLRQTH